MATPALPEIPTGATIDDFDPAVVARAREVAARLRALNNDADAVDGMAHFQAVILSYGAPLYTRLVTAELEEFAARPDATDAEIAAAAEVVAEIARVYNHDTDGSLILSGADGRPKMRLGLAAVPADEGMDATVAKLTEMCGGRADEAKNHISRLLSMYVKAYSIAAQQFPELAARASDCLQVDAGTLSVDAERVNFYLRRGASTRFAIRLLPLERDPAPR